MLANVWLMFAKCLQVSIIIYIDAFHAIPTGTRQAGNTQTKNNPNVYRTCSKIKWQIVEEKWDEQARNMPHHVDPFGIIWKWTNYPQIQFGFSSFSAAKLTHPFLDHVHSLRSDSSRHPIWQSGMTAKKTTCCTNNNQTCSRIYFRHCTSTIQETCNHALNSFFTTALFIYTFHLLDAIQDRSCHWVLVRLIGVKLGTGQPGYSKNWISNKYCNLTRYILCIYTILTNQCGYDFQCFISTLQQPPCAPCTHLQFSQQAIQRAKGGVQKSRWLPTLFWGILLFLPLLSSHHGNPKKKQGCRASCSWEDHPQTTILTMAQCPIWLYEFGTIWDAWYCIRPF